MSFRVLKNKVGSVKSIRHHNRKYALGLPFRYVAVIEDGQHCFKKVLKILQCF